MAAWFPVKARITEVLSLFDNDLYIIGECTSLGDNIDVNTTYNPHHPDDSIAGSVDVVWREAYDVDKPNTQRFHIDAMKMMLAFTLGNRSIG
jgi:hypothetical protein